MKKHIRSFLLLLLFLRPLSGRRRFRRGMGSTGSPCSSGERPGALCPGPAVHHRSFLGPLSPGWSDPPGFIHPIFPDWIDPPCHQRPHLPGLAGAPWDHQPVLLGEPLSRDGQQRSIPDRALPDLRFKKTRSRASRACVCLGGQEGPYSASTKVSMAEATVLIAEAVTWSAAALRPVGGVAHGHAQPRRLERGEVAVAVPMASTWSGAMPSLPSRWRSPPLVDISGQDFQVVGEGIGKADVRQAGQGLAQPRLFLRAVGEEKQLLHRPGVGGQNWATVPGRTRRVPRW